MDKGIPVVLLSPSTALICDSMSEPTSFCFLLIYMSLFITNYIILASTLFTSSFAFVKCTCLHNLMGKKKLHLILSVVV